jgi:hypothetical protein
LGFTVISTAPARVDYQLIVSDPAPHNGTIDVVVNRHRRDFSDQQRELIDLLRPHLRQAAAIAALLSQPVPEPPRRRRQAATNRAADPHLAACRGR